MGFSQLWIVVWVEGHVCTVWVSMSSGVSKVAGGDVCTLSYVGVGDISMKNYRKPINRYFWNYRQLIDIEKWKFWNYRKIIDIGKCIKFSPINTWKAKVSEIKFQLIFTKKMQEKLPLLALLPWRVVLIQYWYYCTDSYVITFGAILCLFDDTLCHVGVFCCLFYTILSPFIVFYTCRCLFVAKSEICTFPGVKLSKKLSKADKSAFF